MTSEIESGVLAAVRRHNASLNSLGHSETLTAKIDELGIDSIAFAELIFEIEDTLKIQLSEAIVVQIQDANTLGEIIEILSQSKDFVQA